MSTFTNNDIAGYLEKLKTVYMSIDDKKLKKDIQVLEKMVSVLRVEDESPVEQRTTTKKQATPKSQSYKDCLQLIFLEKYDELTGTKLDYRQLTAHDALVDYFEKNAKTKILKDTTALDLKLIYSLLTEDQTEIKGNKGQVFDAIKRNIRARKRGEAFTKIM